MATSPNHYIAILCGGTGPRLWPLSHADFPKQFLKLFGKKTILEQTLDRVKKVVPAKNIFIVSNQKYQSEIEKFIGKKIPSKNIIFEPSKKNTAMAITLLMSHIYQTDPDAIITTTPSDHYIQKNLKFKKNINFAYELAKKHQAIATIGIKPTNPNPSYGYILAQQKSNRFSSVSFFIEKPDVDTAEKLIKKNCYWNSDIHTFKISTMLSELKTIQPEYYEIFEELIKKPKEIDSLYKKSPNLNINQAISEKSKNMLIVPAEFSWSDIGEWKSIYTNSPKLDHGHALVDSDTQVVDYNSKNCLITSSKDKLIGLIGVNNIAVIDTPDSLLICNLDQSAHVRDLVTTIVNKKKYKHFFLKK